MEKYLTRLNEEQIKPVFDTEGAVLVIAGAGSGKTRVLTSRIAHIVNDLRVPCQNVLAITFTNKAADEMKNRLAQVIADSDNLWVSTIHSMSVRILRSNITVMGYTPDFSIYDDTDKERVIKRILTDMQADEKEMKNAKFHISNAKNECLTPDEYLLKNSTVQGIRMYVEIMKLYDRALREANSLDFDDLLVKVYELLADYPEILQGYANRFRYIHVDEFQDTNVIQYKIIKLLASVHGNLFVVGDDDQSIYSWRGARIGNMLNFDKDFPGAKVYKLEQNYRSTKKILSLANCIIKNNRSRRAKTLWTDNEEGVKPQFYIADDENAEAGYTATQIKSLVYTGNYEYSDFAVLMRVNALSRAYEQEFMKYGIPYRVYGGFKFFERKEIKDVVAYMKLVNNPLDNEAFLRIINYPKRGIGEKTVSQMRDYAKGSGLCLFDAVVDIDNLEVGKSAKEKITEFRNLITGFIVKKETDTLTNLVKTIIRDVKFSDLFVEETEENKSKKMNIDELINSVAEFEKANENATLSDYLNSVTLSSDTDDIENDNAVTIATIHAVKGLEFKNVFVCGLDATIFPLVRAGDSPDETEEERRLMYVAITRARERLYLTRARSRFLYGDRRFTAQSDFVKELGEELGLKPAKTAYISPNRDEAFNNRRERYIDEALPSESHGGYNSGYANRLLSNSSVNKEIKNRNTSGFSTGKLVRHPKFGTGTIIAVKGEKGNEVADVAFKGIGIKSLALRFAPLELL